jgi:hypothetical protein
MKYRRRDKTPEARRWCLDIATQTPRHCRACFSESPLWRFGVAALVHRHRRAGALALTALSRWRIDVVARVHAGTVALRLGFAALARFERSQRFSNDFLTTVCSGMQ